jgi:hypothetical protein
MIIVNTQAYFNIVVYGYILLQLDWNKLECLAEINFYIVVLYLKVRQGTVKKKQLETL